MLNHFSSVHLSEMESEKENHISRRRKLVLLRPVLIRRIIVGVLIPEFRTEQNRGSNPMPPTEQVFCVTRLGSRALANDVVEVFIPNRDVVVRPKLPLQIVHDCPLRGIAG